MSDYQGKPFTPKPPESSIAAANGAAHAPVVAPLSGNPALPPNVKFIDVPFENALGALTLQLESITAAPHVAEAKRMAADLLNRYMREKQEREQLAIGADLLRRPDLKIATDAQGEPIVTAEELEGLRKQLEILDFWAERMKVTDSESDRPLHKNPDARVWAREFLATIDQIERREGKKVCDPSFFDEGWLVSWFANAMSACYDFAMEQVAEGMKGTAIVPMEYAVKAGLYHCRTHNREARGFTNDGRPCCAPELGGILMPCECVLKDPESPVES